MDEAATGAMLSRNLGLNRQGIRFDQRASVVPGGVGYGALNAEHAEKQRKQKNF